MEGGSAEGDRKGREMWREEGWSMEDSDELWGKGGNDRR